MSCLREERDQRRNDIEHLATSLVGKVNECVAALDEGVAYNTHLRNALVSFVVLFSKRHEPQVTVMHTCFGVPLLAERTIRMQEQAMALKRFGEDISNVNHRLDTEKVQR